MVSTEIDYSYAINPKQTIKEWNIMGNSEKDASGKIENKKIWKNIMKVWKEKYISSKKELHSIIINRGKVLPLRQNMINMVIQFQCMKV